MILQTKIETEQVNVFDYNSKFILFGSCFAQNIGDKIVYYRFSGDINPFGILYNPISIANAIDLLIHKYKFVEDNLFEYQGLWHSWYHHGVFSSVNREECLFNINERMSLSSSFLRESDCIIITFGSSVVYENNGMVVANCHKLPAKCFSERRLSVDEIVERYTSLIGELIKINPNVRIIMTVSPVRYMGGGAFAGQCNKAVLLLAVEQLRLLFPEEIIYFPSYEIVMDELRDYRFYNDDMIHPSPLAVNYVWERFVSDMFTHEAIGVMKSVEKLNKALMHRPLHEDTDAYQNFVAATQKKIEQLKEKYPSIVF